MTTTTFVSVTAAATLLLGTPTFSKADHRSHDDDGEAIAALGGFIGGLIVRASIDEAAPRHSVAGEECHPRHERRRHGHWEWATVRVWVPGCWTYVERRCERPRRVWVEGHYDYRRERVWVSHRGRRCERSCD